MTPCSARIPVECLEMPGWRHSWLRTTDRSSSRRDLPQQGTLRRISFAPHSRLLASRDHPKAASLTRAEEESTRTNSELSLALEPKWLRYRSNLYRPQPTVNNSFFFILGAVFLVYAI